MCLLDHIFYFNNKSFFDIRPILSAYFWKPVWKSFKVYSCNCIILSFGITKLNIVKLIKASKDIKNNDSIWSDLRCVLLENLLKIIFRLIKLTVCNFSKCSSDKVHLFWISLLNIKLMFNDFTHLSLFVKNHNPPLIVEQITIYVLISLFHIYIIGNQSFSAKTIYQLDFTSF